MKLRIKFQDEDFDLGEVVDVAMTTNPDGRITLRGKADKGGEITVYYKSLDELNKEWEDYKSDETKRYRLIKDLPTFDVGDEFYIAHTGALWYDGGGDDHKDDVCAYATQTLMKFPNILTDWFEPINDKDTSILNKEPLIKDEKIRKAVRAWAEANGYSVFKVCNQHFNSCKIIGTKDRFNPNGSSIEFLGTIAGAKTITYAISQLCGDEE